MTAYIDGKRVPQTLLGAPPDTLSTNRAWSQASIVRNTTAHVDIAHMALTTLSIDTAANIPSIARDGTATGISFEGCVEWDSPSSSRRDFDLEMVPDRRMTVQMCATMCEESAVYATGFAVGRNQACYCGSARTRASAVSDQLCSAGCMGDGTIKCGGHLAGPGDYFSVYSFDTDTRARKPWNSLPNPMNAARPIFLGGHAWNDTRGQISGGFMGNIADLAIFDRALGAKDIDCLFRETARRLGSCDPKNLRAALSAYLGQAAGAPGGAAAGDQVAAPDGWQDGQVHLFPDPWGDDVSSPDDDVLSGAHKVGQSLQLCTQLSPDMTSCATVAQIAAGVTIAAPVPAGARVDAAVNFAADGTFGLSLWFQSGWCDRVAHAQDSTLLTWQASTTTAMASVNFQLVCAGSTRAPSSLAGHVLRIEMVDDIGTAFSTDVSVSAELDSGLVSNKWTNLIVGVRPSKVDIVVDSQKVQYTDFRGNVSGSMGFDLSRQNTRNNVAYPDPSSLSMVLTTFENLDDKIFIGGAPDEVGLVTSDQWVGEMQMLQGFGRPLGDDDIRCLYRTQLAQRE